MDIPDLRQYVSAIPIGTDLEELVYNLKSGRYPRPFSVMVVRLYADMTFEQADNYIARHPAW